MNGQGSGPVPHTCGDDRGTVGGHGTAGRGHASDVLALGDLVIRRLFEVGLTLHAAASIADPETSTRVREASVALDHLADEIRAMTLDQLATGNGDRALRASHSTVEEAPGAAPDRPIDHR